MDRVDKSRRPKNDAEGQFHDWCEQSGILATKRGWPDFICVEHTGEVFVVEVKMKDHHSLRTNQNFVLRYLASRGVPCYRWSPENGLTEIKPEDNSGDR